jgi:hypothetical protein
MDVDGAVMDAVEVDSAGAQDGAEETQVEETTQQDGGAQNQQEDGKAADSKDPYTTQFSRDYRAAMKALEAQHPEQAKFLRQARDNHARLFALTQLEPKGIDGVRERYAMLDGLVRGDFKGPEALTAIQEELAGVEEVDNLLISGDPKAFDALGEDFNAGLAKLAPAYLERIAKNDPAAFEAAVLPHFVSTLAGSDLVKEFNALVDVLNSKDDPRFDDATKMKFAMTQLGKMGQWLNGLQAKAGEIKPAGATADGGKNSIAEERAQLEQERQTIHWDTKIKPGIVAHENKTFDTLFDPYQKRLKLDQGAKEDLQQAFKAGLTKAGNSDAEYLRQMKIYRAQKNPDPVAVANFVRNAINKHSKPVMEALIKARYSPFLAGKPKPIVQAGNNGNGTKPGPVSPNVEVRTVMPPRNEIDFQGTPVDWMASTRPGGKQYRLYSGKVIQVRPGT